MYYSVNGGASFTKSSSQIYTPSVTGSLDGSKVITVNLDANPGHLYMMSSFSNSWVKITSAGQRSWVSFACSADCSIILAAASGSNIFVSKNAGSTWTAIAALGAASWKEVQISNDGVTMGAFGTSFVYISRDSGLTWESQNDIGTGWSDMSISSDGSHIALVRANTVFEYFPGATAH